VFIINLSLKVARGAAVKVVVVTVTVFLVDRLVA